jgi:hypothetical protein
MIKLISIVVLLLNVPSYAELNFDVFIKYGISVQIDVFSGRPNPVYPITDSNAIAAIVNKLSIYTASDIDSALIKYPDSPTCDRVTPPKSGYRGLFIGLEHLDTFLINIGNQTLAYRDNVVQSTCKYIWDRNSELEKLIIAAMPQDSIATLGALIPDSLKPNISIKTQPFEIQKVIRDDINYPNPFSSQISFNLSHSGISVIKIYNTTGQLLKLLIGNKNIIWDGRDDSGHLAGNGTYYCEIRDGEKREVIRIMLIK